MILLADDEPAFQRLTASWLCAQGHEVMTVGDGDAARAAFAKAKPDVVLLDLAMPPHHDPQAGIALIPAFAPAPVVVMTGHADQALAMQAIEAGAWDFLAKPVDPDMLKVVVARAVERARLAQELAALRARDEASEDMGLIGQSPPMVALRALIRRVAPTTLPVMVLGPSGTGKELVARAIHAASARAKGPLVPVHCGAVPADLLESELFGHLKGSFTGAHADRAGLVEAAHGGTLFLDEIGEMPSAMQVKLLRFLADGSFREDLYYRLKGVVLTTPRLDDRGADKALLAQIFLRRVSQQTSFSQDALAWIARRPWPGNVRELRAAVECAVALAQGQVGVQDLVFATGSGEPVQTAHQPQTLEEEVAELERRRIVEALARTGHNHTHTARELGLSRVGLLKKMDRMGLR